MKLFLGQERRRRVFMGTSIIICWLLILWAQVYDPLQEEKTALIAEREKLTYDRGHLTEKLKKITEFIESNQYVENEITRFDALKIGGKTIEELSAGTQLILQQFLNTNSIPIKAYKDLPASKWREHPISRVELQIETGMKGVSSVLEYLETLDKVIRVERLTVFYRKKKDSDLQVSFQIATLQMEGIKP